MPKCRPGLQPRRHAGPEGPAYTLSHHQYRIANAITTAIQTTAPFAPRPTARPTTADPKDNTSIGGTDSGTSVAVLLVTLGVGFSVAAGFSSSARAHATNVPNI